jgi:hypothetical protein
MGRIFAPFGLEPDALHKPFVFGLQVEERGDRPQGRDKGPRLTPAKRPEILEVEFERPTPHPSEQRSDFVRDRLVDVADEPERHVIVLGIDPARTGKPAAQRGERLSNIGGNFETGEDARHGDFSEGANRSLEAELIMWRRFARHF